MTLSVSSRLLTDVEILSISGAITIGPDGKGCIDLPTIGGLPDTGTPWPFYDRPLIAE